MLQTFKQSQILRAEDKSTAGASGAAAIAPYKVYANLEPIRGTREFHLEVIDGFLLKPESLAFSHAEILNGGIFAVCLSVVDNVGYSTYYRSEPMEVPPLSKSLLVKVLKNGQLIGMQHIDFENNLLPL